MSHPKITRLATLFLLLLTGALRAQPVAPPSDPAKFEIYLLVGQSNMAGRGKVTAEDKKPVPNVLILNSTNEWVSQGDPIHFDKPVAGVGLGLTFGKLMAEKKPGTVIGLVPCAVGGTAIAKWKPGAELFKNAVVRAELAQKSGTLKGILWHQGEAESGSEARAQAYAQELTKVATGFREALHAPDAPFIAGELGHFLYTRSEAKSPFAKLLNEQLATLPKLLPNSAVVSAKDLKDKGDELHFDADSQREFGKRYFEALQGLSAK
jgi:hypothetical protein